MKYKSFKEIPVWQKSVKLIEAVYKVTKNFPKCEQYNLVSQLRRSSISVASNIAESWGRYHYADKVRVLYIARGEIEETRSHLAIAKKLKYCSEKNYRTLEKHYEELLIDLNKHKKTLIDKKIKSNP